MLDAETIEPEPVSLARAVIDPRSVPVRFSRLKLMSRSPAHYYEAVQADFPDTLATRLGSGVHALLFDKPCVVFQGRRYGKAWDQFQAEAADAVVLSANEMGRARAIADSVRSHPTAQRLLYCEGTVHEQTIDWSWMGRACRSTPDALSHSHLVDLKTTVCSEPGRFSRDGMYRSYHAQLAFYRQAVAASGRPAPRDVYIVSVESSPPYVVTVLQLTPRALEQGERLMRAWFERLLVCEASNAWPGYVESIAEFDVADPDGDGLIFPDEEAQ